MDRKYVCQDSSFPCQFRDTDNLCSLKEVAPHALCLKGEWMPLIEDKKIYDSE